MRRNSIRTLTFLFVAVPALAIAASDALSLKVTDFALEADGATCTLLTGPYRIVDRSGGQRIIMEGFGSLMTPGEPLLPIRNVLLALPPGTRARSVEVRSTRSTPLAGTYRIQPSPPIMPLPDCPRFGEAMGDMQRQWQANYDAAYLGDKSYPDRTAWLSGSGTLREYSYVSVAFCPFTYHPASGHLTYHGEVEIAVTYDQGTGGGQTDTPYQVISDDRTARKAASVFANYRAVADLYRAAEPGLMLSQETHEYVIITTAELAGAIASSGFPTWKTALGYSLRTVLVTDTEITSQPGGDLAERIRNFLRAYYTVWGIEYVLLVGDYATVPMRICYPNPDFHVYDPSDPGLVAPGTPTDYYYADLSFPDATSWDSDGDGYHGEYLEDNPDFLAEVAVGRIPVNDSTRITYTLDKLVAFEQDTGAWKNQALLAGAILFFENQDYSGYPFVDGATCLDSIETGLMGGLTVTHFSEQSGLVTSLYPWPALTENAFNTAWRTGEYAFVNWSGHGWCDGAARTVWEWDDGDGVPESDGSDGFYSIRFIGLGTSNLDDDHPSIVFGISCNVGYPDPNPYGNLGIDLLTLPGWGASAGIVSSSRPAAVSGDWKASPGGTESICFEFNRYMIVEGEKVGDAIYDSKFYCTTNYGWDHYYEYMNLYNFNLYGDPALEAGGASASVTAGGGDRRDIKLSVSPNCPNPFTSATVVRFTLPVATRVRVMLYDAGGRHVATLADRCYPAGEGAVTWDGKDSAGRAVASGLYFIAVEADRQRAVRKTVLLR